MEAASLAPVRRRRRRIWLPFLALLLLLAIAGNVVLALKYHAAVHNNPMSQQQQLLNAVAQDVILPKGMPTISTVADRTKITNASLVGLVQNGDKILVYAGARRLIVYRPSVGKVVAMFDITDNSGSKAAH